MTLAETYAGATALPLGEPEMMDTFYPLDHPADKAVLIHAFAGATVQQGGQLTAAFPAKIYAHFDEVIRLVKTPLEQAGYKLYQIGGPGEPGLTGIESLVGKTTLHQCAYLVRRCGLLIGTDSIWAHVRGATRRPQVHVYGSTSAPHFPQWRDEKSAILIESHRCGKRPSYAAAEGPKTIDFVPPEAIAKAALTVLGVGAVITHQSLFFGDAYKQPIVEVVPDMLVNPGLQIPGHLVVRMDHAGSSEEEWKKAHDALAANLQHRKCLVITDREINPNLLTQFRPQIAALRVEVDKIGADWLRQVKKLAIPTAFFSSEPDAEKLRARRLELVETCLFDHFVPPTKEDFLKAAKVYLNRDLDLAPIGDRLQFRTNKLLLSDGKIYLSEAHWRAGQPTPNAQQIDGRVIDTPLFWSEQAHFHLFTT